MTDVLKENIAQTYSENNSKEAFQLFRASINIFYFDLFFQQS